MPKTSWTRPASGRSSLGISPGWRSLSRRHFDSSAIRRTDREMELFEIPTGPGVTGRTANQANADGTDAAVSASATLPAARRISHATETRRLYATDWRAFVAWCRQHRQTSLPTAPETVAAYLASLVDQPEPLSAGTLSRRVAAIAERHRRAGHAVPTSGETVRALLRAARQTAPSPRRRAAPAQTTAFPRAGKAATAREAAQLAAVAARCPGDLAGLRDRALLLAGGSRDRRRDAARPRSRARPARRPASGAASGRSPARLADPTGDPARRQRCHLRDAGAGDLAGGVGHPLRAGVPQGRPLGQRRAPAPARRRPAPHLAAPGCRRPAETRQAVRRVMTVAGSPDTVRPDPAPVADPPIWPPDTDWLHHRLQVSGPAEAVALFTTAAQGAGIIPWVLDLARIEEDLFLLLAAATSPAAPAQPVPGRCPDVGAAARRGLDGAAGSGERPGRIQPGVPARPARAAAGAAGDPGAGAGPSGGARPGCGGTGAPTQALRHVAREPAPAARKPKVSGAGIEGLTFWSADWTPWRAFGELKQRWPALRFEIRPTYATT